MKPKPQKMQVVSARLPVYVVDMAKALSVKRGIGFSRLVNDLIVGEAARDQLQSKGRQKKGGSHA